MPPSKEEQLLYEKLCRLITAKFENEEGTQIYANFNSHTRPKAINGVLPDVIVITKDETIYITVLTKYLLNKPETKDNLIRLSNSKEVKGSKNGKFCIVVSDNDLDIAKNSIKLWDVFVNKFYIVSS